MASEQVQVASASEDKIEETSPLVAETGDAGEKETSSTPTEVKDIRPKRSGIPSTSFEDGFYRHFMNPMMAKLEDNMKANNDILDEINRNMEKDREDRRKKQLSKHIPEILQGEGQLLQSVMHHIEELIVYDNYEKGEDETKLVKAKLKTLDKNSEVAILSHSIGAYVSTLEPYHLKHFSHKIVSDTTLWLSRLFRFPDTAACFHEEEREGLVRVCRLALHQRYPKFATDGYEALYARPPVIYISAASRQGFGQYLCAQLGLPKTCLSTVPVKTSYGLVHKMDLDALEKLIEDDKSSGKTPVLIVAYAGTPVVGHVDNLQKLNEMCKKDEIWLHVEGNNLATLMLYSVPTNVLPAKSGDSMTLNLGGWLGLPAVPYTTLFKSSDPAQAAGTGLLSSNAQYKLNCLPLWVCLQNLGHDGAVHKVQHTVKLAQLVRDKIDSVVVLKNINKKVDPPVDPSDPQSQSFSIGGLITKAINALVIFELDNPTVVFKYQQVKDGEGQGQNLTGDAGTEGGDVAAETENQEVQTDPYYKALNIWLAETLKREVQQVHVTAVEIENEGICIRFAPMESAHMFDTTEDSVKRFIECLDVQVTILDATVKQRQDFQEIVEAQDSLRLVILQQWAGLGAVQYIPERWLDKLNDLPDQAKHEINALNHHLLQQLKSSDNAFSLGQTEEGGFCVRFGLITKYTDLEELIGLVYTTGKEVEESAKFLDNMADVIKNSIEKANLDLAEENQHKLAQEGVLRQIPLVGSMINWWSPPSKDLGIKGRSLNLASGAIESTEKIYKYHMQVQEASAEFSPKPREGPLKNNLKPSRRRSGGRSTSETSTGSNQDAAPASPTSPELTLSKVPEDEQQVVSQVSEVIQGSQGTQGSEVPDSQPGETSAEVAKEATEGSTEEGTEQQDLK